MRIGWPLRAIARGKAAHPARTTHALVVSRHSRVRRPALLHRLENAAGWRVPVGPGWSGFAVSRSIAVTLEQAGDNEQITALDLATGQPRWRHAYPAAYRNPSAGTGPRVKSGSLCAPLSLMMLATMSLPYGCEARRLQPS